MTEELDDYILRHIDAEPERLHRLWRATQLHLLYPRMASGHLQGRMLVMLTRMIRPQRILELGTFTGYSALCLAEGLAENGRLITIEHNDELEETIRRNLALSPLGEKIELVITDAKEYLTAKRSGSETVCQRSGLSGEAGHQIEELFDLVFIDADKREYCTYLDLVAPLVRTGGFILADNTLWDGHIIDPAYDKDAQTLGLRRFNEQLAEDPRFEQVILPLRDGLTLIRKV